MYKTIKKSAILVPYIFFIFPNVKRNLRDYKNLTLKCQCESLKEQALLSIDKKEFHCLGGSVYSLGCKKILPFITSFQTISDYLDNLCDRAGVCDEDGFRLLHQSMIDCLTPARFTTDYYEQYALKGDGGYLNQLVLNCQEVIETLPSYPMIRQNILKLTELYRDLQVYKHLDRNIREEKLKTWFESHRALTPSLYWWEFAAATGSTLTTFALLREAVMQDLCSKEVKKIYNAYFPWIAGLHILLDYLIDQKEDQLEGDLNFVSYYENYQQMRQRLLFFVKQSLDAVGSLKENKFHDTVVKGLLAMYLSDPKVKEDDLEPLALELLCAAGKDAFNMYNICLKLRTRGTI